MKKILGCLFLLPVIATAGENGGVAESNFEVGLGYSDTRDSSAKKFFGSVNVPVGEYVGSTLSVNSSSVDGNGNTIGNDSYGAEASLFLRDFNLGKFGAEVSYDKLAFDDYSGRSFDDVELYQYTLVGEYYLKDYTFKASRTQFNWNDDRSNFSFGSIAWYLQSNTSLSLASTGMDDKDNYGIIAKHQPEYFNNSTELTFSYYDSKDDDAFSLIVSYHFDSLATLKERDRKY